MEVLPIILKVNLLRLESDNLKINQIKKLLKNVSGILIPGGFGKRGTEGKIAAINYARINKIPFLEYVLECKWPLSNLLEIS